eukprot:scaffold1786_cov398-Prasinococcus_capsulatus_cf.AAC.13
MCSCEEAARSQPATGGPCGVRAGGAAGPMRKPYSFRQAHLLRLINAFILAKQRQQHKKRRVLKQATGGHSGKHVHDALVQPHPSEPRALVLSESEKHVDLRGQRHWQRERGDGEQGPNGGPAKSTRPGERALDGQLELVVPKDSAGAHALVTSPAATVSHRLRQKIFKLVGKGAPSDVLVATSSELRLTRQDLRTILGRDQWLNDEAINAIMQLIVCPGPLPTKLSRGCYCFSSFLYTRLCNTRRGFDYDGVRKWTSKVNIFLYESVVFPINIENVHWCLAVAKVRAHALSVPCRGGSRVGDV